MACRPVLAQMVRLQQALALVCAPGCRCCLHTHPAPCPPAFSYDLHYIFYILYDLQVLAQALFLYTGGSFLIQRAPAYIERVAPASTVALSASIALPAGSAISNSTSTTSSSSSGGSEETKPGLHMHWPGAQLWHALSWAAGDGGMRGLLLLMLMQASYEHARASGCIHMMHAVFVLRGRGRLIPEDNLYNYDSGRSPTEHQISALLQWSLSCHTELNHACSNQQSLLAGSHGTKHPESVGCKSCDPCLPCRLSASCPVSF